MHTITTYVITYSHLSTGRKHNSFLIFITEELKHLKWLLLGYLVLTNIGINRQATGIPKSREMMLPCSKDNFIRSYLDTF